MSAGVLNRARPVEEPALFLRPRQQWLHPVQLSAGTIASRAAAPETIEAVLETLGRLEGDEYLEFMTAYYRAGLEKFSVHWGYLDLLTVMQAAVDLLKPRRFLEIGVRRGRSMAIVGRGAPDCAIVGFDLWMADYAGMPNPGPDFVRQEIQSLGHCGPLELISGDSHQTVPEFLAAQPDLLFDIINVDGDHSEAGAKGDLLTVLPRLAVGGMLVMDDIAHPQHRYLETIWDECVGSRAEYTTFKYRDLGYGVALAVRKE